MTLNNELLIDAAGDNDLTLINKLLSRGADVNVCDESGTQTPLISAVTNGHPEAVALLASQPSCNINFETSDGYTVLIWASIYFHPEIVRTLLQHGALIDYETKTGKTALIAASLFGEVSAVQMLLSAGAMVDYRTKDEENSALLCAAKNGHINIVKALIRGYDINLHNNRYTY